MKNLYLFWSLTIAYFLLASCSPKETIYFARSTGSFNNHNGIHKEVNVADHSVRHFEPSEIKKLSIADSIFLPATNLSATKVAQLPLPKQTGDDGINSSTSLKKDPMHVYPQLVTNSIGQNTGVEKNLITEPDPDKKVQGAALVGFILSLLSLSLLFLPNFIPLLFLFALSGSILMSINGLRKIKKNPDKYSGKGFAWFGITVGTLLVLIILGYYLSWGA